ncbi:hypothetical protein PIB30_051019 [Stylosanthes scabra]|uniref:Uncharacterized protein n=1 Tax=Stylosanthes scabra TaxID=79078 RepID=A0ABU6WJR4_9FABA|nr:hypothetical protein [Stylosanthes scabra]
MAKELRMILACVRTSKALSLVLRYISIFKDFFNQIMPNSEKWLKEHGNRDLEPELDAQAPKPAPRRPKSSIQDFSPVSSAQAPRLAPRLAPRRPSTLQSSQIQRPDA